MVIQSPALFATCKQDVNKVCEIKETERRGKQAKGPGKVYERNNKKERIFP
jgi:hypothetical protein